jgi:hypothetical protein
MLRVPLPWSSQPWAWPFLTGPMRQPASGLRRVSTRRCKGSREWRGGWARAGGCGSARAGLAGAPLALTGIDLVALPVTLIARLRLDGQRYDFPAPQSTGCWKHQPKKRRKKRPLKERLEDAQRGGKQTPVAWSGG